MASPNGPPSPPTSDPPIVPIDPAEYPNYYFERYSRLFPILRLHPSLRNNPADVQLPCVLPVDPRDMEVRVMTIIHPLTLIYHVLPFLATRGSARPRILDPQQPPLVRPV